MEGYIIKIINMSIEAGIAALVICMLGLLLKRVPRRAFCWMWVIVAVRLMCPVTISSPMSIMPQKQIIKENPISENTVVIEKWDGIKPNFGGGTRELDNSLYSKTEETDVEPISVKFPSFYIVCAIWVAGIVGMLGYMCISYILLRRKVREAIRLKDNIWNCEQITMPFVIGIIRPRIIVPKLNQADEEYVICHERAHIKALDNLKKPLAFILLSIYWFNPLIWLAYIMFCRDIEAACDERVLMIMGEQARAPYATALVNCGRSNVDRLPTVSGLGFGSMKRRTKQIMKYRKPSAWIIAVGVIVCTLGALVMMTNPIGAENGLPDNLTMASIPEDWSKPGEYPVGPENPKWSQMTEKERFDSVNMPLKIAKKLSTDDLAVWAIYYPYVGDLFMYGTLSQGFEIMQKNSNVLMVLFAREDAVAAMLKAYEALPVDYSLFGATDCSDKDHIFNEKFVLAYFAQNINTMNDEQMKKLYDIIERNLATTDNEDIKNFLGVSNLGERPKHLQ